MQGDWGGKGLGLSRGSYKKTLNSKPYTPNPKKSRFPFELRWSPDYIHSGRDSVHTLQNKGLLRSMGSIPDTERYRVTFLIRNSNPPQGHHRALGKVLPQDPRGSQFLMSEVLL